MLVQQAIGAADGFVFAKARLIAYLAFSFKFIELSDLMQMHEPRSMQIYMNIKTTTQDDRWLNKKVRSLHTWHEEILISAISNVCTKSG